MQFLVVAGWIVLAAGACLTLLFVATFAVERERRPALVTAAVTLPLLGATTAALLLDYPGKAAVLGVLLGFAAAGLGLVLLRSAPPRLVVAGERERVDERDAVFHRFYRLREGTPEFEAYYEEHPEKRAFDEKVRAAPPLAAPGSKTWDPLTSPFQVACFDLIEEISRELEREPRPLGGERVVASPGELALRVKGFARYLGATSVGCTRLDPKWVYSHIGRSPGEWGSSIELNHEYAIAITVPMASEMVRHSPGSPTTTETAYEYLEAGKIAITVARYIRLLGYEARPHVDGNYRVMCVPVAVDAGLGELGRLGLLMTPELGPRVRISVVTTDMPLAQDDPVTFGVQDFCSFCKKCADACPSRSIDAGDVRPINGAVKWQTERDTCYRYWRAAGSDCNVCVKVCPYSHPRNPAHDLVRWAISRNHAVRRLALWADDLAYGRRPKAEYPLPDWHRPSPGA